MHLSLSRKLKTALRFTAGAARLTVAPSRQSSLISVDVFATVLARRADDDAAWRAGTLAASRVLHQRGIPFGDDLLELRRGVESRISAHLLAEGKCPEFSHELSFRELLTAAGAGDWAREEAAALAKLELEYEAQLTDPIPQMVDWIAAQSVAGRRVIAVSDTRYSAEEICALLDRHKVAGIAKVYASADYAASKYHGKLFDIVCREERVRPTQILHVGDSFSADYLSAAQRGLRVRRVKRPTPIFAAPNPLAPPIFDRTSDDAFKVGYQSLGPALVAFVRLLLNRADRDGVDRLAFVARDGDLLLEIAREITAHRSGPNPSLTYLHLSRRATACALEDVLNVTESPAALDRLLHETSAMLGGDSQLERICNLFGLPFERLSTEAARWGFDPAAMHTPELRTYLADQQTAAVIRECVTSQRKLLLRYLRQEQILSASTALVDIGWRGSIQRALEDMQLPDGLSAPRAYYVGLWDEGRMVSPGRLALGILCDQRRRRTLLESAAWQAAYLLESVCRADHGMVVGFREQADGTIVPVHAQDGPTRQAEQESERARRQVRDGVLAYAQWFASQTACAPPLERQTRHAAQKLLFRLSFFPCSEERALGRLLVHSEPTSDDWFAPLIMSVKGGLKGWLKGARSPWKGGYFRETGGIPLAALYCLAEDVFVWLPPGSKLKLRAFLLKTT